MVVDRPVVAGGGGHGFNGGQLLHLAVAGCISNDLFREAARRGIELTRVVVRVDGGYDGEPAVSSGISYAIEIEGRATDLELRGPRRPRRCDRRDPQLATTRNPGSPHQHNGQRLRIAGGSMSSVWEWLHS